MSLIILKLQSQTGSVIHHILSTQLAKAGGVLATCVFCVITDHRQCLLTQYDFSMISTFIKGNCILV